MKKIIVFLSFILISSLCTFSQQRVRVKIEKEGVETWLDYKGKRNLEKGLEVFVEQSVTAGGTFGTQWKVIDNLPLKMMRDTSYISSSGVVVSETWVRKAEVLEVYSIEPEVKKESRRRTSMETFLIYVLLVASVLMFLMGAILIRDMSRRRIYASPDYLGVEKLENSSIKRIGITAVIGGIFLLSVIVIVLLA